MKKILFFLLLNTYLSCCFAQDNPYAVFGYVSNVKFKDVKEEKYRVKNSTADSKIKTLEFDFENHVVNLLDNRDSVIQTVQINDDKILRFLSPDPITGKYPELTPYQFASNSPTQAIDLDGKEKLILQYVDNNNRTATLTVQKTLQVVEKDLNYQLYAMSNSDFSKLFSNHNTTLYTQNLPQNGQPITYITPQDYNNGKGFAIQVVYDVKLAFVKDVNSVLRGPQYSTAMMGTKNTQFTDKLQTFAHATYSNQDNLIEYNPDFFALANSNIPLDQTYEELTAHELGFHNMMGLAHHVDPTTNKAFYPTYPTLESNVHGNIYPTDENSQLLLNKNITERSNLEDRSTPVQAIAPQITINNTLISGTIN